MGGASGIAQFVQFMRTGPLNEGFVVEFPMTNNLGSHTLFVRSAAMQSQGIPATALQQCYISISIFRFCCQRAHSDLDSAVVPSQIA